MAFDAADKNKFKELFCTEAEEQLDVLSKTLLELERDPGDPKRYATLMRSAHTIKGAAATMGYTEMARLAHALEDVFHAGERKAITLTSDAVSVAFAATDHLALSLASIKEQDRELPVAEIAGMLETLLVESGNVDAKEEQKVSALDKPKDATVPVMPDKIFAAPTSVKVGVEHLDVLLGLFEEMLMLRLKLDTMLEPAIDLVQSLNDPTLKQRLFFIREFETLFNEFARLLSETQTELLRVRLVPLDQIFGQFPRMVRDLSLRESKRVVFHVEGGTIELDRTVLDGLGGALAHLLRNAVDHGITHEGQVTLAAVRVNDRVHVIVEDDGSGIDYARVREIALTQKLIAADDAAALRNADLAELLFHPNMSTNTKVTDVSGRGVGLFAVRAFAQDVGGRVSVVSPSTDHGGTRFVLDLPISLATVKVLLVESSGFTFAVPFTSITHMFPFAPDEVVRSAHQEAVIVDKKPVPLFRLDQILGIAFGGMLRTKSAGRQQHAVLVRVQEEKIILVVDACVGEQELLVKSLPSVLRGIKGFSGSTLLPDGRTVLLLDVDSLLLRVSGDILESAQSEQDAATTSVSLSSDD